MKKLLLLLTAFALLSNAFSQQQKLPVIVAPKFKKDTVSIAKSGAEIGRAHV